MKFFYTIEDFPKFKILEENYQGILKELLNVINKEKQINLNENYKQKKITSVFNENDFIYNNNKNKDSSTQSNYEKFAKNINEFPNKNYSENSKKAIKDNNVHNVDKKKSQKNNKESESINFKQIKRELNSIITNNNNNNINSNYKFDYNNEANEKEFKNNLNSNNHYSTKTFEPWVEKNLYHESNENGWDVAPLMIGGVKIPERCEKFPFLYSLVEKISGVMSASFSLLKPGTHIVPHKGYDDYSEKMFRYHLGLIVPEGDIAIRVEKETKKWENGKSFVFDDFLIHEAWNFTCKNRIVLIIDFLKDETKLPVNIKFFDRNFNRSNKGYLNSKNDFDDNYNSDNDNRSDDDN